MSDKKVENPPEELPSLENRMVFLGILTCIVATSYDYDLTVEGGSGSGISSNNHSGSFLSKFMDTPSEDQNSSREEDVSVYWDDDDDLMRKSSMDDEEGDEATKRARATKIQQKLKLAEERHFVRRYQVALEFIKSSAKHLLVQEDNETLQKKLLPMLDDLLESNAKTNFKRKSSSTRDVVAQVLEDPEKHAQQTAQEMRKSTSGLFQLDWVQDNTQLQEYLEQMNSEAAYQCLCWLFFEHLLHATGGYDARIRYWFKSTAVTVWMQQFEEEPLSAKSFTQSYSKLARASRKFESLEHCIATRLLTLAANNKNVNAQAQTAAEKKQSSLAGNIWKGAQVAGVGVLAGTLLAVTGGLAAPGIAAGLAALGMGAVAGTFLTLASSAAVVSLFGVATGGLAAYKMNRRVSGLSEFTIQQELIDKKNEGSDKKKGDAAPPPKAELFRTVAVSGWLNNGKADFQKPWGVTPSNPPISDKVELLQRFYQVHNHDLVAQAESIWNEYKEKPDVLWQFLGDKYGVDPDHIFDTDKEKPAELTLTTDEETTLDSIIVAIGNVESGDTSKQNKAASDKQEKDGNKQSSTKKEESKGDKKNRFSMKGLKKNILSKTANVMKSDSNDVTAPEGQPSPQAAHSQSRQGPFSSSPSSSSGSTFESVKSDKKSNKSFEPPAHLSTVWNYQKLYGGELYTVRWESDLLVEICDSVRDLALDLASKGGQQVLKYTIASTLMLAASLPITIMSAMGSIDGTWTLVIERADEAGKELARSLLFNNAGHRPVTLVGYSFGARVILSCLKELAQYQQKWEDYQIKKKQQHADDRKSPKKDDTEELGFDREPASIVEDAIMMGMPKYLNLSVWKAMREVVAGRLVNVYSRQDKILSLMFKYKRILGSIKPVVGTCTVAVPGVENVDVTDLIAYHQDYVSLTGDILKRVRYGQPLRASSDAVDEEALMKEAQELAKDELGNEDEATRIHDNRGATLNTTTNNNSESTEMLREWK